LYQRRGFGQVGACLLAFTIDQIRKRERVEETEVVQYCSFDERIREALF